ncbi:hypothetical protein PBCVNY2B_653R [Paramecium bursaria Chlorella virus NY2B]|uniref:Uncharacterized protein n=1 Tax=Paramecium bursaria Chlorella virus NYs1 TaxID=83442 RepID=M1I965_9PHYC|nr:hypothetical protein AR158_C577R [Paramecium bursaria Chlorella virus AR158]YP_009665476.1 hypothetical protein FK949_gp294 [Paramecium bursaria Chlorella virus NYs1]AGE55016.1 hypothetical protein PBCVMA1D_657R [Paramecium bursaria Chlorella virus MA1D]AGE58448.1 hypothetical protein PBCVNY2B_653R [Paramecium bursaria Chlorella virus NY2B]ABU44122.1 hypothetical protein AR158_C577R [Paramecium bursaria Chlorella virus AR158]AGE58831.1 hypothetical protein PBCVNYs1_661R [Paramecium bursaria
MEVIDPEKFLMVSLDVYFSDKENRRKMLEIIYNEKFSLRTLDWFVSNFSKKNNVIYTTKDKRMFNVFMEYKAQLKSYSKKWFDPFCRGTRLNYKDCDGKDFLTTIGQLNFFRWAMKNDIIDYCIEHITQIESDMMNSTKERKKSDQRDKRRELSKAAIKRCTNLNNTRVIIKFD